MAFDPWTATFEEASALTEFAMANGENIGNPTLPLFQIEGAQKVRECENLLNKTKDRFYVVKAAMHCAQRGLVMPDWLATEFCNSYHLIVGASAGSWDDPRVFGKPFPKGAQLAAIRKRRLQKAKVARVVNDLLREKDSRGKPFPVGKEFWRIVGKVIGTTANEAQSLYKQRPFLTAATNSIQSRRNKQYPFFENIATQPLNGVVTITRTRIKNPKSFETLWGVNPRE